MGGSHRKARPTTVKVTIEALYQMVLKLQRQVDELRKSAPKVYQEPPDAGQV